MAETALESKEEERSEQRKLKNKIPLLKEMEMLGNGKKIRANNFCPIRNTSAQCFSMCPSTFWSFLSDMLMGRNDDVQVNSAAGMGVLRTMK